MGIDDRNGFNQSTNCVQLSGLLIYLLTLLVYTILVLPLLPPLAFNLALSLYYFSFLLLAYAYLKSMASNPTDPKVIQQVKHIKLALPFDTSMLNYYCQVCHMFVSDNAKHCRSCNRCVQGFDHHCKWINNCIGKQNYSLFILLISSLLLNLSIFLSSSFHLLPLPTTTTPTYNRLSLLTPTTHLFITTTLILTTTLCLLAFLFLLNLTIFHLYLIKQGLSTYQYILLRRAAHHKTTTHNPQNNQDTLNCCKTICLHRNTVKCLNDDQEDQVSQSEYQNESQKEEMKNMDQYKKEIMDTYEDTKKPINNTNLMKTGSLQKFNVMTESKPNYKQHSLTRLP